jgi:hypothetical protein
LRADGVERLGGQRQLQLGQPAEQLAGAVQTSSTSKVPSRFGSLIKPFQPTVVRGFSK